MAQYTINYLTGNEELVHAATIEKSADGVEYHFRDGNGRITAYIPVGNVLSVLLVEEPEAVTN